MTTPPSVNYPADPELQKVFSESEDSFLEDIKRAAEKADAHPLYANKTEEENRRIVSINIYKALNKAMEKMTDDGKKSMTAARNWACGSGYQSLRFVSPVPDNDVVYAAEEIWKAYKKRLKGKYFDLT